jgi:prolipoprotein diacylglyceryltransferase
MFPVLQIGPLALPVPGLTMLAGVWIGLWLVEKEAARLQLDPEAVYAWPARDWSPG